MAVTVDFETEEQAIRTYLGDQWPPDSGGDNGDGTNDSDNGSGENGGTNGNGTPGEEQWGEVQEADHNFIGGWGLFYQENLEQSGVRRWFVIRITNSGQLQALNMSGVAENYSDDAEFESLPHTENRQEAEAAYEMWLENADEEDIRDGEPEYGDDDDSDDDAEEWSDWREIAQEAGWFIYRRQHLRDGDREEFIAVGQNAEGEDVYLGPDGEVLYEQHIFESIEALNAALQAYAASDPAPEDQPTGAAPGRGALPGEGTAGPPGSNLPVIGPAANAVGGIGNLVLLVAVVLALGYYLETQGHIDLTDRWGPDADAGMMEGDSDG